MGYDTKNCHASARINLRATVAMCAFLYTNAVCLSAASATQGDNPVNRTVQDYVTKFRAGGSFDWNDSTTGLIRNRRLDKASLSILTRELATGRDDVRENIVFLLEKIGLESDVPSPGKLPVISDVSIIEALVVEGFAKVDIGSVAAEATLRRNCRPADLAKFNDIFIASLRDHKGSYLYLASKAKTTRAKPYVEEMAVMPSWQRSDDRHKLIRIAQAALGNTAVEDEIINATMQAEKNAPPAPSNRFYNVGSARDGKEVGNHLKMLGLIGTRRSLQIACSYLRSPLKSYVAQVSERSIRDDALAALLYNFPDERILRNRRTVEEWAVAEKFCSETLGAVFEGPTPTIAPALAYPGGR